MTAQALPRSGACRLSSLRLYQFRNYEELRIELGTGLNVFVGENAQGKTNLLEAVTTLLLTRSPRAANAGELIRWGADEAAVEGVIGRPAASQTMLMRLRRDGVRAIRTTSIDGATIAARDVIGFCPLVPFWPDDLLLVKAGPAERRRQLDIVASQLDRAAAEDLIRYRRILEQRNAALRQIRQGFGAMDTVRSFDPELVERGARIQVSRQALVGALEPLASEAMTEISDSREELGLRYLPDGSQGGGDTAVVASELQRRLQAAAAEEIARGITVVGPHRDDIEIMVDGRPARSTASQGQQRSAVLAIKLAELRHIEMRAELAPVLVLDDVLSELDSGRRRRLLAGLSRSGNLQTLVTTTEADAVEAPNMRRFVVAAGCIEGD